MEGRYADPGRHEVAVILEDWKDDARGGRVVPVKVYRPKDHDGPAPVVLFSHGLGGSREGYEYLGRHWASHGFVCIHLQHAGSDAAVWQGEARPMEAMKRAASAENLLARAGDVKFAIDRLEKLAAPGSGHALAGRVDLGRIAVAGHSFGAHTALAAAGRVYPGGRSLGDARVKAAVALSPSPGALRGKEELDRAFGAIAVPVFHMTGTDDASPLDAEVRPEHRRLPFDHSRRAEAYLLVLEGGDHMVFSGRRGVLRRGALLRGGAGERDAEHHRLIRAGSLAFLKAVLGDDADARRYLDGGEFARHVGRQGTFERRPARAAGNLKTPGPVPINAPPRASQHACSATRGGVGRTSWCETSGGTCG